MIKIQKVLQFALPIIIISLSFIGGIALQKLVLPWLIRKTAETKWKGDEVIANSLKGMVVLWSLVVGVYLALPFIPLPLNFLNLVKNILIAIVIFSVTWVTAKIASRFMQIYANKLEGLFLSTTIFVTVTKIFILTVGLLIVFQTLGVSITPILTALGVGGLAVALALQDTLSNLFAGFHIIISKQVRPGDYIKLDTGEEGYVVDITWRYTSIRMLPNNIIIIPNSKFVSSVVTNYYLPEREMAVLVQVGVSYESDLKKVERVTIEVAKEVMKTTPGGLPEFEPFIWYHTFGDSSINFTVILRVREFVDQYAIKHEFIKRLHERYNQEGIEIPFPIRTVYMRGERQ